MPTAMHSSLEVQLLQASLLCGMQPSGSPVYRLQLFLVANAVLGSKSHQSDFQRSLETAVDDKGLFANFENRGSGEYVLTELGYALALAQCGKVVAQFKPVRRSEFRANMSGRVKGVSLEIRTRGDRSHCTLNGEAIRYATETCRRIESLTGIRLPTQRTSAVRVLQDLAIDCGFEVTFK
jgi:hypothetical protein